ncbi:MAG: hypothetical protein K0S32_1606 [Bacteroidetes bacterium]|jgi:hypothetical protein|nr:hypothetical protein [Bacteroidota bacterium]
MFPYKIDISTLDGVRINLNDKSEVEYWIRKLSCTREDLELAVRAVGTLAENVVKFLR